MRYFPNNSTIFKQFTQKLKSLLSVLSFCLQNSKLRVEREIQIKETIIKNTFFHKRLAIQKVFNVAASFYTKYRNQMIFLVYVNVFVHLDLLYVSGRHSPASKPELRITITVNTWLS